MSSALACGAKPGDNYNLAQEGLLLTTTWPCNPFQDWILSNNFIPLLG